MAKMDYSRWVTGVWRYGSEILKYALLTLIIPLFLVGFDLSGTRTFTWKEFTVDDCDNDGLDVYSQMCTVADNLEPFSTTTQGDMAAANLAAALSGETAEQQFAAACMLMKQKFEETSKVQVTQTLTDLCINFDASMDPYENINICVGTDDMLDGGGYVSGYLYWTRVISWIVGGLFISALLWEKIHNELSLSRSASVVMDHLAGALLPGARSKKDLALNSSSPGVNVFTNVVTHSLVYAAIHTFSVILAVYASLSHKYYNDKDLGMSIDAVTEKIPAKMFSDEDDYHQRKGDCFSSVQAFFTFNVALQNIDDDVTEAPAATQAVYVLSIIIAAISGLVLFSYLIVYYIVRTASPNGRFSEFAQHVDSAMEATNAAFRTQMSRLTGRTVETPMSNVGASVETSFSTGSDTGLFNLKRRVDVPDSVAEEKNGGELFTKNVQAGENIMKLSF